MPATKPRMPSGEFHVPELRRPRRPRTIRPAEVEVPLGNVPRGDAPASVLVTPVPGMPAVAPAVPAVETTAERAIAVGDSVPFPIVVQRHAEEAMRTHASRDVARAATLVVADIGVVALLEIGFRAVRNSALLGDKVADLAATLMPRGTFFSNELITALACGLLVFSVYNAGDKRREALRILGGTALGFALILWGRLWGGMRAPDPFKMGLAMAVVAGALMLERATLHWLRSLRRPSREHRARVLIIGRSADARKVKRQFPTKSAAVEIVGYLSPDAGAEPDSLGMVSELARVIAEHRIDTVIASGDVDTPESAELIDVADGAGCRVFWMPGAVLAGFEPRIAWEGATPLVQLTRPSLRVGQLVLKRAFDIAASLAIMVIAAPVMFLVAIAVRLSSPGPVLFRQIRVGQGGRHFAMYKFRSMIHDAEERRAELEASSLYHDGRLFKLSHDPRVTRVGAFLRRTSLDELPQLWNVLKGDMSLVGPRPPLPSEVALYDEHHYARFQMKPGMTGPWQVSGRNTITDFQQVVHLETSYMRQWGLSRDFSILFRTVPAVFRSVGAL